MSSTLSLPDNFTIDVHTHPIPEFYKDALIQSGASVTGDQLIVDGFATPPWTLQTYMENRDRCGFDFSLMSITALGVSFLKDIPAAAKLARRLNDQMASWVNLHPTRLGALGVLPIPDVASSLEEIKEYCLDDLEFEGIGLYTNYNGIYLGDTSFDPIMAELNDRKASVHVHPCQPFPEPNMVGMAAPALEYPFDTTRAIANLLLQGTQTKFPNIKFVFSHGGGAIPYLAGRIAGITCLPSQGGFNPNESFQKMQDHHFDLAASTTSPQLAAIMGFVGSKSLMIGSDFPYVPENGVALSMEQFSSSSYLSAEQTRDVRHRNTLSVFPRIASKLAGSTSAMISRAEK
ncbi:amidohydrolase 2 [Aspergillus cavernicola]|uniref:Amidohydrolase 2 n=1 Tax=Aspergillus cavernicola TaxID=176166 RepID=A0ABR4HXG8_9EURO